MKRIILVMVATMMATLTFAQTRVQERDLPNNVRTEFQKRHPNARNVMWDRNGNQYSATFMDNNSNYVVEFDERGNANRTRMRLKETEIPSNLSDYATRNYPRETYREVERITDRDGRVSYSMRMKDVEHHFDQNGRYVRDVQRTVEKNRNTKF